MVGRRILSQWISVSREDAYKGMILEFALYQQEGMKLSLNQRELSPFEVSHMLVRETDELTAYMRDYDFDQQSDKLAGIYFRNL